MIIRKVASGLGSLALVATASVGIVAFAPSASAKPPPPPSCSLGSTTVTAASVGTPFGENAAYDCGLAHAIAKNSWSNQVFSLTGGPGGSSFTITVTDIALVGDQYQLWGTNDATLASGWKHVGNTSEVFTDGSLVAPSYNPFWTGTGSTSSSGTFNVTLAAGQTRYFDVRDVVLDDIVSTLSGPCGETAAQLFSTGCDVAGIHLIAGYSPAGFTVDVENA
jgi:hypothetical protein